jgi:hypothetical protein
VSNHPSNPPLSEKTWNPTQNTFSFKKLVECGKKLLANLEGLYLVQDFIPAFGFVGMLVGHPKAGKTTLGLHLAHCIATGTDFFGRKVGKAKVLFLAIEDPIEHLEIQLANSKLGDLSEDAATVYVAPLVLDKKTLDEVAKYVTEGEFGFVYIASFTAGVRSLIESENDNLGMSNVVGTLKAFARKVGVPVLVEAHAGKNEDVGPNADPIRALRGATGAAAEADFVFYYRPDEKGRTTVRVLSGRGRLILKEDPLLVDFQCGELRKLTAEVKAAKDLERLLPFISDEQQALSAVAKDAGFADSTAARDAAKAALLTDPRIHVETRQQGKRRFTWVSWRKGAEAEVPHLKTA